MSAEQWTLSRIVGRNGQPRTGWHLNMPDEWPEHSLVEAVCVVPVAERDALAARVEELEARIARALRTGCGDYDCHAGCRAALVESRRILRGEDDTP